jgi:predicted TIM-barrel fold metal-dependent hydrolase
VKIDMYAHACPQKYIDDFEKNNERGLSWRVVGGDSKSMGGAALFDAQARVKVMETIEDYAQILIPGLEVLEPIMKPKDTVRLVQSFNNGLSEWIDKYPHKFLGAAASIPMNDTDAALREIERAITQLGFKGIAIHTPVYQYEEGRPIEKGIDLENRKSLDAPEFWPIYEAMSKYNYPIWIHPNGTSGVPAYKGEMRTKFALFHIFGWPIETMMAMSRLVCGGVLAKYPNLKFITHHCGSMIVPALASRIDEEFDRFVWAGGLNWEKEGQAETFKMKRPLEYYKMFYGDTALYGGPEALELGQKFFGPEHIVFGTDFSMDMQSGTKFIKWTTDAIYKMHISDAERQLIFEGNARLILRLGD